MLTLLSFYLNISSQMYYLVLPEKLNWIYNIFYIKLLELQILRDKNVLCIKDKENMDLKDNNTIQEFNERYYLVE